jgi:hypothetical protein
LAKHLGAKFHQMSADGSGDDRIARQQSIGDLAMVVSSHLAVDTARVQSACDDAMAGRGASGMIDLYLSLPQHRIPFS